MRTLHEQSADRFGKQMADWAEGRMLQQCALSTTIMEKGDPVLVKPVPDGARSVVCWSPKSPLRSFVVPLWYAESFPAKVSYPGGLLPDEE